MASQTKRATAGRPKGWSPKTGWHGRGLTDQRAAKRRALIETFEGVCCAQVERIETALAARYSLEVTGGFASPWDRTVPDNRYMAMPQNDHMTRLTLQRDGLVESRGLCGAVGRSHGGAQ